MIEFKRTLRMIEKLKKSDKNSPLLVLVTLELIQTNFKLFHKLFK